MAGRPRRSRDERGFSLTESIVALAVLGLVVASMVGGLATSIATSDIHRQQSETNAVLVSAVETIKQQPYSTCASSYSPTNTLPANWPGATIQVSVQYWNPQSSPPGWDTACHDNDGSSLFPMQLVTIKVTDPGGRASASLDIVKRTA